MRIEIKKDENKCQEMSENVNEREHQDRKEQNGTKRKKAVNVKKMSK